jgi:PilZ domain
MSTATANSQTEIIHTPFTRECRVYERYPSDLATHCQPLAARSDNDMKWSAIVHDISAGGIGLLLQRRFEPRTGLAIELPDAGNTDYTVFVRVVHARAQPDGRWLLGCQFVSPLSEERLHALRQAATKKVPSPARLAPPAKPAANGALPVTIVAGVHFRAKLPDGSVLSRSVTRLHVTGDWPMPAGRIISVWLGKGPKNGAAVEMKVNDCHQEGDQWLVDCTFVGPPPTDLVRSLDPGKPPL